MAPHGSTNEIARHLLEANEDRLAALAPVLMDRVAEEIGLPAPPLDHKWPADVIEATREFLVCVATDDMERLGASGGIFERIGLESARGGVEAEALYDSIRMAARLAQAEVHRAVLLAPQHLDPEAVLGLPVAADELATTLRPLMADVDCIVGPAVPITEFPDSLAMGQRLSALRAVAHSGPTFVDDSLLELVCVADPVAVRALRRKYFGELDPLPEDQRAVLVETLRQWLLQWGHRPGIAQALTVHPQTVSGRLHRLRDLLADDLEDAVVRAELLVLLTAEGPPDRRSLLCSPCQESDNRGGLPGPGCEPVSSRRRARCGCASTRCAAR